MTKMLTANRLHDGEVVYWTADGEWRESLTDALLIEGPDQEQEAHAAGRNAEDALHVVGAYLVVIDQAPAGAIRPKSMREHIRAAGPTVRLDLGKQAQSGQP